MSTHIPPFTRVQVFLPVPTGAPPWMSDHLRTLRQVLDGMQTDLDTLAGRRGHAKVYGGVDFQGNAIENAQLDAGAVLDPRITVSAGQSFKLALPGQAVGDVLTADSTTSYTRLADVTAGAYLRSAGVGAVPVWSTLTLPNAATVGDLLHATGTNIIGRLADVATGAVLTSGGVGVVPGYSTHPTLSGALTAAGLISSADPGAGVATQTTLTNAENTAIARGAGVGTILFADAVNRNCLGFAKIYLGVTAVYLPVFAAN